MADSILVQVAYAIGVARPVSLCVNTYGTSHLAISDAELSEKVAAMVDMRPNAIEKRLKLRNPIYRETATYGHMGREPRTVTKHFHSKYEGDREMEVELFTWEKLDLQDAFRKEFNL